MEKERINFELKRDDLMESVALYVRDDKINRALNELKRVDKSNLAIIQETIKILEEGFVVSNKEFEAQPFADLAAPLEAEPIGQPAIPNTIKDGKVVLPDIKMSSQELADAIKGINQNMFKGGMF